MTSTRIEIEGYFAAFLSRGTANGTFVLPSGRGTFRIQSFGGGTVRRLPLAETVKIGSV